MYNIYIHICVYTICTYIYIYMYMDRLSEDDVLLIKVRRLRDLAPFTG